MPTVAILIIISYTYYFSGSIAMVVRNKLYFTLLLFSDFLIMPYKIVKTFEKGKSKLSAVPSNWEIGDHTIIIRGPLKHPFVNIESALVLINASTDNHQYGD